MNVQYVARRGALASIVLVLVSSLSGCGGCSRAELPDPRVGEEEEEFVAPGTTPPVAAPATNDPAPTDSGASNHSAVPAADRPMVVPDEEFVDPATRVAASAGQFVRPRDLTGWSAEDFLAARRENDPNLVVAVPLFGQRSAGDGAAAALLIQLLQMSLPSHSAEGSEPEHGELSNDSDLGRALIAGIGATRTAIGRELIKQVLRGKARTPFDDFALTSAAIEVLAEYSSPENEEILYVLLTRPEQVRPAATTGVTADGLRDQCLTAVAARLSPETRLRLARHAVAPATPASEMAELLPLLVEPSQENLEAQVVVYGSERIADETKARVQTALTAYSSAALDRLLGVPLDAAQNNEVFDRRQFAMPDALAAAEALWSGSFGAAVALRVQGLGDVDGQADVVRLACNVPSPAVRCNLYRALQHRWLDAPAGFSEGRVEVRQIRDPGFLLVVKSLPREDDPRKRRLDSSQPDGDGDEPSAGNPARTQAIERIKKERAAKYAWMDLGEQFVRELNGRFRAAALAERERQLSAERGAASGLATGEAEIDPFAPRPDSETGADAAASAEATPAESVAGAADPRIPLTLHAGAEVVVAYNRRWPADLTTSDRAPDIAFLEVHYLRMEVDDRMGKLVGFYNRQLKRSGDHFVARGRWLESLERDAETGRARSIDVLISRLVDEAPISREVEEKLIVEILVVEAPDPTRTPSEVDSLAAEATAPTSLPSIP